MRIWVLLATIFCSPAFALEIVAAGDSITQGLFRTASGSQSGVTSPQNGRANFGGYLPRLNSTLDDIVEPSTIYNFGVAGANSRDGFQTLPGLLDDNPADMVLIMYGANDLYQGISDQFNQAFVREMVRSSLQREVIPVIAEITPNTSNTPIGFVDNFIRDFYNVRLRGVAEDFEIEIANMYQVLRPGWLTVPYHSGDELHMRGAGNREMADEWLEAIVAQLDKLKPDTASIIPAIEFILDQP